MKKTTIFAVVTWLVGAGQIQSQTPITFQAPKPFASARFGSAMAAFGNNVLIGAPGDTVRGVRAGVVYLLNTATGDTIRTFRNPAPVEGDGFGSAIAVAGSSILIGAPFAEARDPNQALITNAGKAYLYAGDYTKAPLRTFQKLNPGADDQFGSAVALLRDTSLIVIAAPNEDFVFNNTLITNTGALYRYNSITNNNPDRLANPTPRNFDRFGAVLAAFDNASFIVGTPSDGDSAEADAGAAYLYNFFHGEFDTGLIQTFVNRPRLGGHGLGASVATFSSNVLVGAAGGAAYLFDRTTGLVIRNFPNPGVNNGFGAAIAGVGNFVIVGAPADDAGATDAGAIYVFDGSTGNLVQKCTNPTPAAGDSFSLAVAPFNPVSPVSVNQVLVGAPFDDGGSANAGAAYLLSPAALSCALHIISPLGDSQLCGDSIAVRAVVRINGGTPPFTRSATVNGTAARFNGDTLTATIPLYLGPNLIAASCDISDAISHTTTCVDRITVTRLQNLTQHLAINEILYDPNYADLGTERLELRNLGDNPVRLDSVALWIRRDTLNTYWIFPKGFRISPRRLLTVHWLASGQNDSANVFTGTTLNTGGIFAEPILFWGNNSSVLSNMALGGPSNINNLPFSIALVQGIVQNTTSGFSNPCNMADFVQIGGPVSMSEDVAVAAKLWNRIDFVSFAPEGNSLEFLGNAPGTTVTTSKNFFAQPSPSIGFPNVAALPPSNHLLITEICMRPDHSEFIEIFNPDSTRAVSLADYYLTDNIKLRNNAYTRLVKGADSLQIEPSDFFARFPADSVIRPLEYQTIAISATDFIRRYRAKPTYEIFGDDALPGNNMRLLKPLASKPKLDDSGDAVILLKWDGQSDLVEDVDVVTWGKLEPPPRTSGVPGPSPEAIDKTRLGIDGVDADNIKSFYDNELAIASQRAIANQAHELLKSWQRRPIPREFDETPAGGNSIAGHDEMSEDLDIAFRDLPPTPSRPTDPGVAPDDELDLEFVPPAIVKDTLLTGNGDGILNPGEDIRMFIRLKNNSDVATGPLFSVLRFFPPFDALVTLGADSTASYNPIAPGAIERSVDSYEFSVKPITLPDTIRFVLLVVDKQTGRTFQAPYQKSLREKQNVAAGTVPSVTEVEAFAMAASPNLNIFSKFFTIDGAKLLVFLRLKNTGGTTATNLCARLDMTNIALSGQNRISDIDTMFCRATSPCDPDIPCVLGTPCVVLGKEEKLSITIPPSGNVHLMTPGTTLCGKLLIRSGTYNRTLSADFAPMPVPFVSVTLKYPKSTVLVPNFTVKLIETTNTGTITKEIVKKTDNHGHATDISHSQVGFAQNDFNISPTSDKNYRLQVIAPPATPGDQLEIDALDLNDGVKTCEQRVAMTPQFNDDKLLGDVNTPPNGFTIDDCAAINAFVTAKNNGLPIPPAALATGQWRVADTTTAPPIVTNLLEVNLGSGNTASPTFIGNTNKFFTFKAMLLGDLNASWKPPDPVHRVEAVPSPCTPTITDLPNFCPITAAMLALEVNGKPSTALPKAFELYQNFPNPLLATTPSQLGTTIHFALPKPELVSVKIYDILGKLVKNLVDQPLPAGPHHLVWRGDGDNGEAAVSGLYFVRLQAGSAVKVQRIVLLR
jgi:hypothetical protein